MGKDEGIEILSKSMPYQFDMLYAQKRELFFIINLKTSWTNVFLFNLANEVFYCYLSP